MSSTIEKVLTSRQAEALEAIKTRTLSKFEIAKMVLYGSIVRNDYDDKESDIDLLILTKNELSRTKRHQITEIIFEENLKYETNFSGRVIPYSNWENGLYPLLTIYEDVKNEGILVYG